MEKTIVTINNDCIACGACESACPVGAIKPGDIYVVDPATCVGCLACTVICPMSAIAEKKVQLPDN